MRIPLNVMFGLLLLVPVFNRNELSRVEAASEKQSITANTRPQQDKRDEQAQQGKRDEQAQQAEREAYVKSIQAKLDEYDKKLDVLEASASTLSGAQKDDFKKMIEQLRLQQKSIASRLNYVKNASPDAFSLIKADADSALAKLESSYQDVSSKRSETTLPSPSKNQQK